MLKYFTFVIMTALLTLAPVENLYGAISHKMSQEKTVIILLGPPGSGKGTQAVQITNELDIPHISTGDLFRYNIKNNTALGKEAQRYMDAGKLVPDSLVLNMLADRVSQEDCANGYLLDGFPRTIAQAQAFVADANLLIFNLSVSDELIIQRISGRLVCKECGRVYNKYFTPPKSEKHCDHCNGEVYQRSDDQPEVVQERLKVYHEQTKPLIGFYESKGAIHHLDGEKEAGQIFAELMEIVNAQ